MVGSRDVTGAMWWWWNHPPTRPLACRPVNGLITPNLSSFKPQPSPAPRWWGFSVPALFSQDQRWRNYLQLCLLSVCFSTGICSRFRLPRPAPLAGEFLFQDAAPVCDQMLWRLKAAPLLVFSVIVGSQQAQDKHAAWFRAKSCPGRRQKRPPGGGLSLGRKRLKRRAAISCCTATYNEPLGAFNQKYPSDEVGSEAFVQTSIRYQPVA
jgi:hypothetical protein